MGCKPHIAWGALCVNARDLRGRLEPEEALNHKKEALLAESLDWADSTCNRRLALEQADERLLAGVRLREHRCASLLKDLEAGQLTALSSDIYIDDPAVRGFEIHCIDV